MAADNANHYALELRDLRKSFGKTEIIRGANLAVAPGERVAITKMAPNQLVKLLALSVAPRNLSSGPSAALSCRW